MSDIQYEKSDIEPKAIVKLAIGLIAATLLSAMVSLGVFKLLARYEARADPPPAPMAQHDRPLPNPFLQAQAPPTGDVGTLVLSPVQHLAGFRAEEEKTLGQYAWLDKNAGTVRIPIEKAMELLLARGVAAGPAPAATPQPPAAGAKP
jgi:hypothetical protein